MADGYRIVDRDVYYNMSDQAQQARQRMAAAERNLQNARVRLQQSEEELWARSRFDARQFQSLIREQERRLTGNLDELNENLRMELGRQNVRLRRQLDELRTSINASNQNMDALNRRINQIAEEFNAQIRSITERMAKRKGRAQYYVNQLDALLKEIDALHPDKLAPGRAEQLHESRNFIASNIANGDYEAAIGMAQGTLVEAVALQSELETMNDEFSRLAVEIARIILSVCNRIQELSNSGENTRDVMFGSGEYEYQYTYDGNLNYWSSGLFGLLCSSFDREQDRVNSEFVADMDLENMRTALHNLPIYQSRLQQCSAFAAAEFAVSCSVQNLAVRINDSLTSDGSWVLWKSGFEGDDNRRSYALTFIDGFQNTVSIVLIPSKAGGDRGEIQFSVQAFDGDKTTSPGECTVIRNAVLARLNSSGIEIGDRNRSARHRQTSDPQTFILSACGEGSEIKEGRIASARQRLSV